MNNGNKQMDIDGIRTLIAQLELMNRRVERELRKINRRLSTKEINTTIIAKARIVN